MVSDGLFAMQDACWGSVFSKITEECNAFMTTRSKPKSAQDPTRTGGDGTAEKAVR